MHRKTKIVLAAAVMVAIAAHAANDWENTSVNSINREPPRAYSMPLADEKDALTDDLEPKTPYRVFLNGKWRYSWCGNPSLRPLDFWKTDFDDSRWFTIDVPSCVEMRGFGSPGYTNVRYPHANKWPQILDRQSGKPDYNPVSSYRRTFAVPKEWKGRDVFLRFDGVYSAYYVWVNGERVGYAEDSKLPSEFNITRFLKDGENLLCVEVYRWCDGSYLEDQDMFRFSGIYRDVSIFAAPKTRIDDFRVMTGPDASYTNWMLILQAKTTGDAKVAATLYDADFKKVGDIEDGKLVVKKAHAWSAEDPYLYTLVMKAGEDVRACRVGFKNLRIIGGTLYFNGKNIKFKGVNRHECSPWGGRTVSLDWMEKDIKLFKRFNINTVRTSHYPNHHTWYDLCDRYGIYVVAEANVEGHEPGYGDAGLGRHEEWYGTILERNVNHVVNYKNHPCIFMWSMGNETGHGDGFRRAIKAVKKIDPTRPVHWERGNADADVDSAMYPTVEWLAQRGRWGRKPFFLCEYAHAMGNAIGNLQEYWDEFYAYNCLSGGCIWDWVDQAIWKPTGRVVPGTRMPWMIWGYGGDWDESPNDGPFCVNGVVDSMRHVTAKLIEVGHVYRNLVVEDFNAHTGVARLWNRFGFTSADAFDGKWTLLADGRPVESSAFAVPAVAPFDRGEFTVDFPRGVFKPGVEYFVNFEFKLRADTIWAEKGHVVARDQKLVRAAAEVKAALPPKVAGKVSVGEDDESVTVKAGRTKAVFCRGTGTLSELEMNGITILKDPIAGPTAILGGRVAAGPQFTCERAFTDNDCWLRGEFYASGLTQLRYHARPLKVEERPADGVVVVTAEVEVTGSKSAGFAHKAVWTFRGDGTADVENTVEPHGTMPQALPRIGTTWRLDKALENMAWYGRGPRENYIDRCTGSFFGWWESTVLKQHEYYVRPQDNGYKCDVRSVRFTDKSGRGIEFRCDSPMFVQALHAGMEDLEFARHRNGQQRFMCESLLPCAEVMLNLDVRQLGLGGASCGPRPMQKYIFPIKTETWRITLSPVGKPKGFFGF